DDRQVVIADIPGLIEGAAAGAGLGHEFLAHVERCRLLVHLVDINPAASSASPPGAAGAEGQAESAYTTVRQELADYGAGLGRLPEIVVLSKRDLLTDEEAEAAVERWRARLGEAVPAVLAASSVTGAGLDELRQAILTALPEAAAEQPAAAAEFEAEHRVYRPGEDEGFDVVKEADGRYRVKGRGIEMLVARHDLSNPEALDYLEGRLREIGVIAELQRAGFEPGDEVVVGEVEFDLDPA
ncbi:MAG: Obg family GTPase CgtA, partial [Solirubrobacterales bacterium]